MVITNGHDITNDDDITKGITNSYNEREVITKVITKSYGDITKSYN